MSRNPSMHILFTDFVKILDKLGFADAEAEATNIFKAAVPFNIKSRYIVAGDAEARKKARRVIAASAENSISVEKFNRLLTSARMKLGHKSAKPIRNTDPSNWLLLKEIAQLASEFSRAQGLGIDEGCEIYIDIGLDMMKHGAQYSLGRFKYYNEKIDTVYIAMDTVVNDPKSVATEKIYHEWQRMISDYGGISRPIKKHTEYVYFVYVRIEAEALGAKPSDWLKAQFEGMDSLGMLPDFGHLIGDGAVNRYYRYMQQQSKNFKKKKQTDYDNGRSEFEEKYFEALRAKAAND